MDDCEWQVCGSAVTQCANETNLVPTAGRQSLGCTLAVSRELCWKRGPARGSSWLKCSLFGNLQKCLGAVGKITFQSDGNLRQSNNMGCKEGIMMKFRLNAKY